jgi:hypothetical protein
MSERSFGWVRDRNTALAFLQVCLLRADSHIHPEKKVLSPSPKRYIKKRKNNDCYTQVRFLCARKSPATPRMFFDFAGSESVVSRQKKISGSADHFLSIRRQTWLTLHQSFFCLPTNFICSTRTISTCLSNSYMAAQWCGFQSMNKSQRFASPSTRCPQKLRLGYHWASLFQPLCGFAFTGRVGIHICQF